MACKVASPSDLFTLPPSTLVSSVAKSLLPTRRRLRLDPPNEIYFPYEPGKQVRSVIAIKNTCKSHVAFKDSCFKQLLPRVSCYMHPPGGILAPGQSIIATEIEMLGHSSVMWLSDLAKCSKEILFLGNNNAAEKYEEEDAYASEESNESLDDEDDSLEDEISEINRMNLRKFIKLVTLKEMFVTRVYDV
ncbi:hypothetical protein RIF29_18025 [Crotalaria pallida]|uniref:MSP domain-containing protein n=1 Tax=Crotalaria pallida TaxID=3830 RepID=A0AAN9IFU5_CROPI